MATNISTYLWPGNTRFGFGAVALVGEEAVRLGTRHAFILTDPGVNSAGLVEPVLASLRDFGVTATVYTHCPPNPDVESVDSAAVCFRDCGADLIIGLGGGSPLDAAKAVRELAGGPPEASIAEYALLLRDKALPVPTVRDMPPMIGIPTTAGTGAEVTPWGVITDLATMQKKAIGGPALIPTIALIDPELTLKLPPYLTAATGIDALSHCIEAYVSTNAGPVALDPMILFGIELLGRYLPVAVNQPNDGHAREQVMLAALIGGIAISSRWLGAAHSLAHQLSTFANVHHGLACSLMLPAQMEFSLPSARERYGRIAAALDPASAGVKSIDQQAELAVQGVRRLVHEIGLPTRLRDVGVTKDLIPKMTTHAFIDLNWTTNPRPVTEADLEAMYRAVY
ncbi:MAG: iron-containing alcohol dehydrogenase [Chloroflexota bacterium]|jgi:4-hydroxybutyrate dehydrogenase